MKELTRLGIVIILITGLLISPNFLDLVNADEKPEVTTRQDGTKISTYQNGTKITSFPNGTNITTFANGTSTTEHTRVWIWTFSHLEEKYWKNECFLKAVKLAEAIAKSQKGQNAYKKVNKAGQAFNFAEVNKTGLHPEIAAGEARTLQEKNAWGWYKGEKPGGADDIIYLEKKRLDKALAKCNTNKKNDSLVMIASTILHETAHWKENVMKHPNLDYDPDGREEGEDLIVELFGNPLDTDTDGNLKNPTLHVDDTTTANWANPGWWTP